MILYGRFHSPFVRRVAVWMNLQARAFEHQSIMVTGDDFERLKTINPMGRVPALQIDDGTMLVETFAIVDYLEQSAAVDKRLLPESGMERVGVLQTVAAANSLAEKAVALVYETIRRPDELYWADWISRVKGQVTAALDLLEASCPDGQFAGGDTPNGGDVAAVCGFDFTVGLFADLIGDRYPKLQALSDRANALPAFASTKV